MTTSSGSTRSLSRRVALLVCVGLAQACTGAAAAMTPEAATARAQALLQPGQPAALQARASARDTFTPRLAGPLQPDTTGRFHIRFDRAHQGVPVDGGDIIVHLMPDGALDSVTSTLAAPLALPTVTPRMPRDEAQAQALAAFRQKGRDASSSAELRVAGVPIAPVPTLAWRVEVQGTYCQHPSRMQYWFDAQSGRLLAWHDEQESAVPMSCRD